MIDAYDKLFERYPRVEFFEDGFNQTIFIPAEKIAYQWEIQKQKLLDNGELFIRGYGRDAKGTLGFLTLYRNLFGNLKIKKDPTNNNYPTRLLVELTKLSKSVKKDSNNFERIQNYQVSHLFGRTKNPLLFTTSWNLAYIPKYLDPFTGHETQGTHRNDFQNFFLEKIKVKFTDFIKDYNLFIQIHVNPELEKALLKTKHELKMAEADFENFSKNAKLELSEIN